MKEAIACLLAPLPEGATYAEFLYIIKIKKTVKSNK
jgi:hypothetical protein